MPPHPVTPPLSAPAIRILVADRSRMVSQLLAESLGRDSRFEIVAIAAGVEIFSAATREPDVALISTEFVAGSKSGLAVTRALHSAHPNLHIVVLLEASARESVIAAFCCGATGVFCGTQPLSELRDCIEQVSRGKICTDRGQARFLLEALRNTPSCKGFEDGVFKLLSKRELEVAERAAQGKSNMQIADELGLSEHTVKNYLFRIFEKLGISSRFELLCMLFNERNNPAVGGTSAFGVSGQNHSIESYLKAAEEGFIAAQYLVGLAHLEGYSIEKNGCSAYYWLRIAEENSSELQQHTRALTDELRSKMRSEELETLEHNITGAIQRNKLLTFKKPSEFIKRSMASASLRVAI